MAWIDDRIWCHPRIVGVPPSARWIYVASIAYSSGFRTKGHLTNEQCLAIGARPRHKSALINAGLWHQIEGGIWINDWDEHNGKSDLKRERERQRKRDARLAGLWNESDRGAPQDRPDDRPDPAPGADGADSDRVTSDRVTVLGSSDVDLDSRTSTDLQSVQAVYDHWRKTCGKTRANYNRISPQRRRKIQRRLREFSVDELCAALDGVARDPWEERPQHNDLTVVFRSQEQVEKFLEMADAPRSNGRVKVTGWRMVRGSHGTSFVRDDAGTDRPPREYA